MIVGVKANRRPVISVTGGCSPGGGAASAALIAGSGEEAGAAHIKHQNGTNIQPFTLQLQDFPAGTATSQPLVTGKH